VTQRIYVDRSRYEIAQRCARARWYEYHHGGMGITSARKPLPLAVGSSVHVGLANLLTLTIGGAYDANAVEDFAVKQALADFAQHENAIDVDTGEIASRATLPADAPAISEMDAYLYREQCALVEAMVRAYTRRRLRPLLEQFEVLEVEREGEWLLSSWREVDMDKNASGEPYDDARQLWFMSRPDALLRERESNQLYLLSFKTAASWDIRKARDAEHDMQGMSEGVEIEQRLAGWHSAIRHHVENQSTPGGIPHDPPRLDGCTQAMYDYLVVLDAPPRILAVRYEYMLKGERWKDKELSARFGVEMRSQKSHLIRQYVAHSTPQRGEAGYKIGDTCWSWEYTREDGRESKLAYQNWNSRAVWEHGAVKDWIDKLDDAAPTMSGEDSTVSMEPRLVGYKCDAQAMGVTKEHPLDAIFIPPVTVYRQEDELRDLVEQMEHQERRIAEGVRAVREAEAQRDEGEIRHALNVHFPMTRRACEYPSTCFASKICFGSAEIRRDPIASGLYKIRVPNHPVEGASHD